MALESALSCQKALLSPGPPSFPHRCCQNLLEAGFLFGTNICSFFFFFPLTNPVKSCLQGWFMAARYGSGGRQRRSRQLKVETDGGEGLGKTRRKVETLVSVDG